jgi:hypothetical protein
MSFEVTERHNSHTNINKYVLSDAYYLENQNLHNLKLFISLAAKLYLDHTLKYIKMYISVYKLAV